MIGQYRGSSQRLQSSDVTTKHEGGGRKGVKGGVARGGMGGGKEGEKVGARRLEGKVSSNDSNQGKFDVLPAHALTAYTCVPDS
jgi:hypothetical protein